MQFETGHHAGDEMLEQYSMGRLDARTSEEFEEHLLICEVCQDNLASADLYRGSMRGAALEVRQRTPVLVGAKALPKVKTWFGGPFGLPKPVWIPSMAALALVVAGGSVWPSIHRSVGQPAALVMLESNRGAEDAITSSTPMAKPFTLVLDIKDLPALPQYRLEIVDSANHSVFGATAAPENNKLRATVAHGLPGGMYYVRVYGQELLREYGLQARN